MSLAIIVEDDSEVTQELKTLLKSYDEGMEFQIFRGIKEFSLWTKEIITLKKNAEINLENRNNKNKLSQENKDQDKENEEDAVADSEVDDKDETASLNEQESEEIEELEELPENFEINMLFADIKVMPPEHASLFEKLNMFYRKNDFLGERERLPIFFIAREIEEVNFEQVMNPLFDNVYYHPFDKRVVQSLLNWSLDDEPAASKEDLHSEKPLHAIEMLKDVKFERLTEFGFKTLSSMQIEKGKVAKYYFEAWQEESMESIFAKCVKSEKHPEQDDFFQSTFTFLGISNDQIDRIREYIKESEAPLKDKIVSFNHDHHKVHVATILRDDDLVTKLNSYLSEYYSNVEIHRFNDLSEFLYELDIDQYFDALEPVDEIVLTYSLEDSLLLDGDEPIESWNGLTRSDLMSLKTRLMSTVLTGKRKQIQKYFNEAVEESLTLGITRGGVLRGITLESSEIEEIKTEITNKQGEVEEKITHKVHIKLRGASKDEMLASVKGMNPLPERIDALFIDHAYIQIRDEEFWQRIHKKVDARESKSKTHMFSVGHKHLQFYHDADRLSAFDDHFIEPLNRSYFVRKVGRYIPELESKEDLDRLYLPVKDHMLSSVPVDIERISETSCSITYYREIAENRFRRFMLWSAKNKDYRMLLGVLKNTEPDPNRRGSFLNHFMFYGLRGETNQYIRKWLNEQYVLLKEEERKKEESSD